MIAKAAAAVARMTIGATVISCSLASEAFAQGVTSAGIRGVVRIESPDAADVVNVQVTHRPTARTVEATTRKGVFFFQGLEPGGPYSITARKPGFVAEQREVMLRLGAILELELVLRPVPIQLDSLRVTASRGLSTGLPHAHGGTGTTIDNRTLSGLPSLNRDFYDFVRLVPQISTRIGLSNAGFSAGGAGFRFNNFLINGVSERSISGNVSTAFAGSRSMSLEAVQEYQVLLAPYDVRYGDFAGALVNTVTRSGDNTFAGSVFAFARNDRIARRSASDVRYDRVQYGLSLGGPLIRNRLHFFLVPEIQHLTSPAPGPYLGQPAGRLPTLPVSEADIERMNAIMQSFGLEAGSARAVTNSSPLRNFFGRLDFSLPEANTRVAAWHNEAGSAERSFTRSSRDTFSLTSARVTRHGRSRQSAINAHTSLRRAGGGHNELLISRFVQDLRSVSPVAQPVVRVSVPATSGARVTLNSGTPATAQGTTFHSRALTIKDNVTLPLGQKHIVTAGAEAEHFYSARGSLLNSYGTWSFDGLDALENRIAERYEVALDLGIPNVPIEGWQYAAYVTDMWRVMPRLSITAGIRADLLSVGDRAPYHAGVDSIFGRRTDAELSPRVEFSPRIGFVWSAGSGSRHILRGGAGLFTSRFPLAWAHTALTSHGAGTGVLRCGRSPGDPGPPPQFNPDRLAAPQTCSNGAGISVSRRGDVDLLAENLRLMRTLRASLAYTRSLARGLRLSGELLATRGLSEFMFVNLNLAEPTTTDRNGRVMYGTLGPSGTASPALRSTFSEVVDLVNISGSRAHQLSAGLEKTGGRFTGGASYTFSRVRDAVTPLRVNTSGTVAWASSRVVSGRHDDRSIGTSSNDLPHRVSLTGIYAIPRRWRTELSFFYIGESGRPFTYLYYGTLRRGDLNADGTNTNDPVYVPQDVRDVNEILFDGDAGAVAEQQSAFEQMIDGTDCLRRQRGKIAERNSCREPWSNTTAASVRQTLPIAGRKVELQADLYNVLNFLRGTWGVRNEAAPLLLQYMGQSSAAGGQSQPIVRFEAGAPRWTTVDAESVFQFQVAMRYRF